MWRWFDGASYGDNGRYYTDITGKPLCSLAILRILRAIHHPLTPTLREEPNSRGEGLRGGAGDTPYC